MMIAHSEMQTIIDNINHAQQKYGMKKDVSKIESIKFSSCRIGKAGKHFTVLSTVLKNQKMDLNLRKINGVNGLLKFS